MMIDSAHIRRAYENTIQMLGESNSQLLNEKLGFHGVNLDDPELTLEKVAYGINMVMGVDVSELIIDKILLELDGIRIQPLIKD